MARKSSVDLSTGEVLDVPSLSSVVIRPYFSRLRVQFVPSGDSLTHQSHMDSCDVNKILARYERTGQLPPATRKPVFMDVTGFQGDLTERYAKAKETIRTADEFVSKRSRKKEVQGELPIPPVGKEPPVSPPPPPPSEAP